MKIDSRHHDRIISLLDRLTQSAQVDGDFRAFDHEAISLLSLEAKGILSQIQHDHEDALPPPWSDTPNTVTD